MEKSADKFSRERTLTLAFYEHARRAFRNLARGHLVIAILGLVGGGSAPIFVAMLSTALVAGLASWKLRQAHADLTSAFLELQEQGR